jgi:hypothetical protein
MAPTPQHQAAAVALGVGGVRNKARKYSAEIHLAGGLAERARNWRRRDEDRVYSHPEGRSDTE